MDKSEIFILFIVLGFIAAIITVSVEYRSLWLYNLFALLLCIIGAYYYNTTTNMINVKNPEYFLYSFIIICIVLYILVIYYIFDLEKSINMGRYYQSECTGTPVTLEKETVRYNVNQYFLNNDKFAGIYYIAIALTVTAQILVTIWLLTSPRSNKVVCLGLYSIMWIAIVLITLYLADWDNEKKAVVSKINIFDDDYNKHINRVTEFFKKYFDMLNTGKEFSDTGGLLEIIAKRYNSTNLNNSKAALKANPDLFVSFIDFKKDNELILNFIKDNTGTSTDCGSPDNQPDLYEVSNKFCFKNNYDKYLFESIEKLKNFDYNAYTRSLYDKTARLRNPFLLFTLLFIAYFYHNILCEKFSLTEISFGAIALIAIIIIVIFILKYVGVLAR